MAIAPTLAKYLEAKHAKYDVLPHEHTPPAVQAARGCHIPGDRLAKAVLLRDATGYALAVLPASHRIRLAELKRQFGDDVELAGEQEIFELFDDCVDGSVPALGECYGLDLVVEEDINASPEIYFEAGDRATLVHMSLLEFSALTATAQSGHFSRPH